MQKKSITVTDKQKKFLEDIDINLSFIVQQELDKLIEDWDWKEKDD